ncbi:hypothetical protein [Streptomyces xiamenensis]|uniref:hypothetical protein n=1 Tax=Streptomyces xiamenensis TaxID=408015 RepID=UPI003D75CFE4
MRRAGRGLLPLGATGRAAGPAGPPGPSRTVLGAGDGWAAAEGGVTGGSDVGRAHPNTVTDRAGLVAAHHASGPARTIGEDAGRTPAPRTRAGHPEAAPVLLGLCAGSGRPIG